MKLFMNIFNKLSIILLISVMCLSFDSIAEPEMKSTKVEGCPCPIPPFELVYSCVDKDSSDCATKCQFNEETAAEGIHVMSQYERPFDYEDCQRYIKGDSGCCDGAPYSKSWEGCCDGKTYLLAYDTCCEGRIVPLAACCCNKIIDPETTGCCNGHPYDYQTQACCAGEIVCARSQIRLTPHEECDNCLKRDPSCFYATLDDSKEKYFAQACGDQAVIVFPKAICPDVKVQVCMHPRCGTSPVITGNPKDGYILKGVCEW